MGSVSSSSPPTEVEQVHESHEEQANDDEAGDVEAWAALALVLLVLYLQLHHCVITRSSRVIIGSGDSYLELVVAEGAWVVLLVLAGEASGLVLVAVEVKDQVGAHAYPDDYQLGVAY